MATETWFGEWIRKLAEAREPEAVRTVFINAMTSCGFVTLAAGEMDMEDARRSSFIINTWPQSWLEYYDREKVVEYDPIVPKLQAGEGSFCWSELSFKTPRQIALMSEARSRGWVDGLVIPIPRGGSILGLISLVADRPVPAGDSRRQIEMFAVLAYERLSGLMHGARSEGNNAGLSRREMDCLALVAMGCGDAEAGQALGIAVSTAHGYVESAKRKLGASTRAQAVSIAAALGLIPRGGQRRGPVKGRTKDPSE
jgi:LuxR family transcriptional regulator, quorum-sensing system regulator BjaR1